MTDQPSISHTQACEIGDILERQLTFEISLKTRIHKTARARVAWAKVLQRSLESSTSLPGAFTDYKNAALAKGEEISAFGSFLTTPVKFTSPLSPQVTGKRKCAEPYSKKSKYLFIKTSRHLLRLSCPSCLRSNFPTLQGLLNHCRLAHSITFATHDECIEGCSQIIEDPKEAERITANGIELMGTTRLPGLRRIFEKAVGGVGLPSPLALQLDKDKTSQGSTILSSTLGLHSESPALAPFLGTSVRRGRIQVWDDGEELDVTGYETSFKQPWRRPYDTVFPDIPDGCGFENDSLVPEDLVPGWLPLVQATVTGINTVQEGTRFHVKRRISITDWSQWIPEQRRKPGQESLTHKWMLTVTSPSYGQHVSTFLRRIIITSSTQPQPFTGDLVIPGPPFSICRLSDRPFLARLRFEWAGTPGQNASSEIEHWVELDQSKGGRPRGEEQMLDIELDRNTIFLPLEAGGKLMNWTVEEVMHETPPPGSAIVEDLLKLNLSRFPMTLEEVGHQPLSSVPYKLVTNHHEFFALPPNQREEIKWQRVHCICQAVRNDMGADSPQSTVPDLMPSIVYNHLESNGAFPRLQTLPIPRLHSPTDDYYCASCGIPVGRHSGQLTGCVCGRMNTIFPLADLSLWSLSSLTLHDSLQELQEVPVAIQAITRSPLGGMDLVAVCDPQLATAIQAVITPLGLNSFAALHRASSRGKPAVGGRRRSDTSSFPLSLLGNTPSQVARTIAPYAALSLAAQIFIRRLVGIAVATLPREAQHLRVQTRVVTPAHIIQALVNSRYMGGEFTVMAACMARPGIRL